MNASLKQELLIAIEACEEKKAADLTILEMDKASGAFTDYFILCTGNSDRQNQTIADEVELQIKRQLGVYAHQVEGYREGEWILVDYTDFIVHIFTAERRAFYGLERLWKSARHITLAEIKALPTEEKEKKKAEAAVRPVKSAAKKSRPAKALSTRSAAKSASAKAAPAKKKGATKKSRKTSGSK